MKKPSDTEQEALNLSNVPAENDREYVSEGTVDVIGGGSVANGLDSYDADSLPSAKASWYFGEWQDLANIDIEQLSNHPDVAKLAALKAMGYQQLNDVANCEKYIRIARSLGCENRMLTQLMIAGVHNSLGKLAALQGDDEKTRHHFNAAVDIGDRSQGAKLARHARSVKEIAKLGLLPQAAKLIEEEAELTKSITERPQQQDSRLTILASEMEIVNHQLSLAYEKAQLYRTPEREIDGQRVDEKTERDRLVTLSPSQLGQDLWVLEKTNFMRDGYFVEFGATDGILLSNTYLLEKEFGWKGLCSEPNPKYFKSLVSNRHCTVSDACISGATGEMVSFIMANEFGGISDFANEDNHKSKRDAYVDNGFVVELTTISLHDFLIDNDAPKKIDYMSIDTEGSEFEILRNFPFDLWDIKLLSIEHNFTNQRDTIRKLLVDNGYACIEAKWDDWYYKI